MTLALALLALLHGPAHARELALRPLLLREAREHRLPYNLLAAVAFKESTFRTWVVGDHGRAFGLFQVHVDTLPGQTFTRAELERLDVNAHVGAQRLDLARRKCGGAPARFAANYNGRPCGSNPYHLGRMAAR